MTTMRGIVAVAATLFFVGLFAGAGTASTETCQDACSDGRRNCMSARKMAHRSCRSGCRETIHEAVAGARAICDEQDLREKACRKLVRRTVRGAQDTCRADCRVEARQAKVVCRSERRQCAGICSDEIDPVCRDACVDDFSACRQELGACVDVCRDERRAAVEACRDEVADLCDPVVFAECRHQARAGFRSCASDCHGDTACAQDLHECIGDCVTELDDAEDDDPGEVRP